MSGELDVKVVGLEKLQRTLERMPLDVARRALREAMTYACKAWVDEMRLRAPKLDKVKLSENPKEVRWPGDLASHIGMQRIINSDLQGAVRVGPSKRTYWGLFQEIGRKASRAGESLSSMLGMGGRKRRSGGSSFMKDQSFVRPTFESKGDEVINRFADGLTLILAEEIKKNV
jgi:HK97 gp10 family phage protein